MTDELEPVVRGIQRRFRDLSANVREERVIRYIVKQLRFGRHLDDILNDQYMLTHTSATDREELLASPALIRAIEEEVKRQFAGYGPEADFAKARRGDDTPVASNQADGCLVCNLCGTVNSPDSNFCRHCGTRLERADLSETTLAFTVSEAEAGVSSHRTQVSGPVLLIRAGGGREGEIVPLTSDVLTIGRSPHSDLFLDDVTVSRHHARIVRDESRFLVEDLNSLNGTYVNRKRIERHPLSDGDELQIGKFKLAFLERNQNQDV